MNNIKCSKCGNYQPCGRPTCPRWKESEKKNKKQDKDDGGNGDMLAVLAATMIVTSF